MKALVRFLQGEDGPTAVEYAIMLAFVFLVCLGLIFTLGQNTSASFLDSASQIKDAMGK